MNHMRFLMIICCLYKIIIPALSDEIENAPEWLRIKEDFEIVKSEMTNTQQKTYVQTYFDSVSKKDYDASAKTAEVLTIVGTASNAMIALRPSSTASDAEKIAAVMNVIAGLATLTGPTGAALGSLITLTVGFLMIGTTGGDDTTLESRIDDIIAKHFADDTYSDLKARLDYEKNKYADCQNDILNYIGRWNQDDWQLASHEIKHFETIIYENENMDFRTKLLNKLDSIISIESKQNDAINLISLGLEHATLRLTVLSSIYSIEFEHVEWKAKTFGQSLCTKAMYEIDETKSWIYDLLKNVLDPSKLTTNEYISLAKTIYENPNKQTDLIKKVIENRDFKYKSSDRWLNLPIFSRGLTKGDWESSWYTCDSGNFINKIDFWVEDDDGASLTSDNTGLSKIAVKCTNDENWTIKQTKEWGNKYSLDCTNYGNAVFGFETCVNYWNQESSGYYKFLYGKAVLSDYLGILSFGAICSDDTTAKFHNSPLRTTTPYCWGSSSYHKCKSNSKVCGFNVRKMEHQGVPGDDGAITDVSVICCDN